MKYTEKEIQEKADEIVALFKSIKTIDYEDGVPIRIITTDKGLGLFTAQTHVDAMIRECKAYNSEREEFWVNVKHRLI